LKENDVEEEAANCMVGSPVTLLYYRAYFFKNLENMFAKRELEAK
jgi:hypothetical protein